MRTDISSWLVFRLLLRPAGVFKELSDTRPDPHIVFFKYLVSLAAVPPVFAYVGASNFGWRLGAAQPLFLENGDLLVISIIYFFVLIFGGIRALVAEAQVDTLQADPATMASAQRVFDRNCAVCHGYDAAGQASYFPDLTDDEW